MKTQKIHLHRCAEHTSLCGRPVTSGPTDTSVQWFVESQAGKVPGVSELREDLSLCSTCEKRVTQVDMRNYLEL